MSALYTPRPAREISPAAIRTAWRRRNRMTPNEIAARTFNRRAARHRAIRSAKAGFRRAAATAGAVMLASFLACSGGVLAIAMGWVAP